LLSINHYNDAATSQHNQCQTKQQPTIVLNLNAEQEQVRGHGSDHHADTIQGSEDAPAGNQENGRSDQFQNPCNDSAVRFYSQGAKN